MKTFSAIKPLFFCLGLLSCLGAGAAPAAGHFEVGDGTFLLDGQPFVIKAAELHYPRIPRPYWDHRIKMCKALGMNTVCLYVFWNIHEPQPDSLDFSGQNDLREFIRLCDENGMKVILRPGPYVCAEWEMGGLPWWLLRDRDIRLRESDPRFIERVDKFHEAVAGQVADLTADRGGPVIMIQVENEYGSYGVDKQYVSEIRDIIRRHFGNGTVLFQCDWASNFLDNGLDDLVWTMNFGTGADIDSQFARLREARPHSPLMCSEFWSGWFDKWGAGHETRPADEMVAGIDEMLSKGISFSLYMTHGGTSWGHWAGANSPGYAPDVTSYDYDAPINEAGHTTPKYRILRETLAKYHDGERLPDVPAWPKPVNVAEFSFSEVAPLWHNLPAPHTDLITRPMEEYGQGFGSILYSTLLPAIDSSAVLTIVEPHDFAQIFVDGKNAGTLDRRKSETSLTLPPCPGGARLDILVEATGRINFGRAIKDYKGITDSVVLSLPGAQAKDIVLRDWRIYNIEDDYDTYSAMNFRPVVPADSTRGRLPAGVYRGHFDMDEVSDTFLDFSTWGKGLVYVNGRPLGRIWGIGPQQTLYMPGCWLRKKDNEILVFDIVGPEKAVSRGLDAPILDMLRDSAAHDKGTRPKFSGKAPWIEDTFSPGGGRQEVRADSPATCRYICLEAVDAIDGSDIAAIAEIHLLDADGNPVPREKWAAVYADSEDADGANRSADKAFDMQESTCWQTAPGAVYPHILIIDMGEARTLSGLRYLPRMEPGTPGAIKNYRIFAGNSPDSF